MTKPLPLKGLQGHVVAIDEFPFASPPRAPQLSQAPRVLFRHEHVNHCPRCQGSAWHVGRLSAECARCGEVLLFLSPHSSIERITHGHTA